MTTTGYQISQAAFAVPDKKTAVRIFEKAFGLKPFTKSGLSYWINSIAVLFCEVSKESKSTNFSHRFYLFTSIKNIKNIEEKLKGGPEKVQLSSKKLDDGRTNYVLQITTALDSYIILTNRGKED